MTASERLRELAKLARATSAAPDYDEEAIKAALWAAVDALDPAADVVEAAEGKPKIEQELHWPLWTEHFYEHNGQLVYKFANQRLVLVDCHALTALREALEEK